MFPNVHFSLYNVSTFVYLCTQIITRYVTRGKAKMSGIIIRPTPGRKKYYGIQREAMRLGVTYQHLWQVLTGRRTSVRIMREVRIKEARS